MTYRYSICYPDNEDIEYHDTPISGTEVLELAQNYPWIEQLKLLELTDEVHYSPSLDFISNENERSFCLTAIYDKNNNLEFSLWYNRPEKVKVLFGLLGEKERMIVDDKWGFSLQQALTYLDYFVNENYALVERIYEK
ncbi:hypothetical protein [Pontibacter sp. G13]|uniref:hypothetical protein n=1 Tax=Pontibacter sp. G13 TaxID=3074898 RepID=UPI002889A8CB|nr:hypothetical protein [Pontibacter sp. G13]WNJ20336.1 hypothetical protein RJD25_07635 [Pontibacter sp. G13]